MDRWRTVVALVAIAGVALVGVQLADPLGPPGTPPRVDTSAPPGQVAVAALEQPDTGDYTLEVRYVDVETGEADVARVFVENSEREVLVEGTNVPLFDSYRRYVTADVAWQESRGSLERWPADYEGLIGPYEGTGVLANRTVVVAHENASTLVLSVNDTDAAYRLVQGRPGITETEWARERQLRADLHIFVDRKDGRLRRVVLDVSNFPDGDENRTRERSRVVHSYSRWGETEVRRPASAGYTLAEFLYDLLDYRP